MSRSPIARFVPRDIPSTGPKKPDRKKAAGESTLALFEQEDSIDSHHARRPALAHPRPTSDVQFLLRLVAGAGLFPPSGDQRPQHAEQKVQYLGDLAPPAGRGVAHENAGHGGESRCGGGCHRAEDAAATLGDGGIYASAAGGGSDCDRGPASLTLFARRRG